MARRRKVASGSLRETGTARAAASTWLSARRWRGPAVSKAAGEAKTEGAAGGDGNPDALADAADEEEEKEEPAEENDDEDAADGSDDDESRTAEGSRARKTA